MPLGDLSHALTSSSSATEVRDLLSKVGTAIGIESADVSELARVVEDCLATRPMDVAERSIRDWIEARASDTRLDARMLERASQIVGQVASYLVGPRVADIGCGDGLVGAAFADRYDVVLTDVVDYVSPTVNLPLAEYNGYGQLPITLPVDSSLLLTVLHHAENPTALFEETARITKQRIVIIESIVPSTDADAFESEFEVAAFFDWFYNRVLHADVPVPFNYNSIDGWIQLFKGMEWKITDVVDLGRDQKLVPEHHVLFVLDRTSRSMPPL